MQVQLSDRLYREAQRRAGEAGFSSVDEYVADVISHDLVEEEIAQGPNLQHLFTPELLKEIDAAVEEIKTGNSFTDEQVTEHFRQKRMSSNQANRS